MTRQVVHEKNVLDYYSRTSYDMGSVRSAYADVAGLCDAIAVDIEAEYTKRGRILKEGQALAAIARRCGDAVWDMRKKLLETKDQASE